MAIVNIDGVIAGCQMPQFFFKSLSPTLTSGRPYSFFYNSGIPGAAATPTPGISGAALTTYAGQIPFSNPAAGNSYLARFVGASSGAVGQLMLVDRLWHNSGLSVTSTSLQTVNSVAFPPRDQNGSSDGAGVLLAIETSSSMGGGTPTITVTYTNSDGVGSRTGTNANSLGSTSGSFYPITLAAGDKGVRSVQSVALSASWVSGTYHLVAYRVIATLSLPAIGTANAIDVVTGGMPQMFDNTVPFLVFMGGSNQTTISGSVTVTQG
jgi:hypothetical protein